MARSYPGRLPRMRLPGAGDGERPARCCSTPPAASPRATGSTSASPGRRRRSRTVTTQAAEKIYRALGDRQHDRHPARRRARRAAPNGCRRRPSCSTARGCAATRRSCWPRTSTFLGIEAVVLGRAAMGETVRSRLAARPLRIWRNGRLIYADALSARRRYRRADAARRRSAAARERWRCSIHASAGARRAARTGARGARSGARAARRRAAGTACSRCACSRPTARRCATTSPLALAGAARRAAPLPRVWRC